MPNVAFSRQPVATRKHGLHRKSLAPLAATTPQNALSCRRSHATAKSVYAFSAALFWLIGPFWHTNSDLFYVMRGEKATAATTNGLIHKTSTGYSLFLLFSCLCVGCVCGTVRTSS